MERRGGGGLVLFLLTIVTGTLGYHVPRHPPTSPRPLLQLDKLSAPSASSAATAVSLPRPRHNHTASLPKGCGKASCARPKSSRRQPAPRRALDCHGEVTSTRSQHLAEDLRFWSLALFLSSSTLVPDGVAAADDGQPPKSPYQEALVKASKRALGGGISGAAASVLQGSASSLLDWVGGNVLRKRAGGRLGWLRTTMNYQYRFGGGFKETLQTLYQQGGIPRFYRGVSFALLQVPLARFGDTAANAFVLILVESFEATRSLPLPIKTGLGSVVAGGWRFLLMPLDTLKSTLQVQGREGLSQLKARVQTDGISALYQGSVAQAVATVVGHYPWFATYNVLSANIPLAPPDDTLLKLARNAFLGLCSSMVSDCCANGVRVIKTTKQTSPVKISYQQALEQILAEGGVLGLLGRGLQTRLLTNGLQGMLFAVAWKYFDEILNKAS